MSRGASPIRVRRARGGSFRSQAGSDVHRRKLRRLLACMSLAVGLGFAYVWQHIQTNLIGYRLRDVELSNAKLRVEISRLQNQSAQLAAPARIDPLAREYLGMVRQGTWDLVLPPQPAVAPPARLPDAPAFWDIQRARWARLGARVHATLGPGRAVAAPPPGEGDASAAP